MTVVPPPLLTIAHDTTLCEGKTLILAPNIDHCDYLWQDGSTQPVCVVRGPGNYSVQVSNLCFTHWDDISVDFEHCVQEIYLPKRGENFRLGHR